MTTLDLSQPQAAVSKSHTPIPFLYALAVTVYALAALVMLILNALFTENAPFVGLIKSFLHLILLPSLVLLPLSLLLRRWRVALVLLPVVVGFALLYGAYFVPRAHAAADGKALTLLTFNVEVPSDAEAQPIVDIVDAADADIVALQELTSAASERLASQLADEYPYRALYPQDNGHHGQGILSRYPIRYDLYWSSEDGYPPLGYQQAEIDLDGTRIAFYNLHPMRPVVGLRNSDFQTHTQAVDSILDWVDDEDLPVIMLGDFNMTDQFNTYQRIRNVGFTDAYRAAGDIGFGFTFPENKRFPMPPFPILRLDYIFYDANFAALNARVWSDAGTSDHHPLLAQVVLLDAGA